MKRYLSASLVLLTGLVFLCAGVSAEEVGGVADANNQFAFELYSRYKTEEANIFFSPYSISMALAMAYEGARGKTADEIQAVFHFPQGASIRRDSFFKIYSQINKKDKEYQLRTANALWAGKDYRFLDDYFNLIAKYYGGKVTNLDFVNGTEKSRLIINNWVEEQTNNKIRDLLPEGVLGPLTRLVLTNAIYFKGNWDKRFDKKNTKEDDFRVSPGKTVKVQMMSLFGVAAKFNYTETKELQMLELPYAGKELSMFILLPKKDNIGPLERSLNAEKIFEWKSDLKMEQVEVYLPRFKFKTKYSMVDTLKGMGMPTACSANADFSGMTGGKDLFIGQVIHQAFVEVNEEGTEAAAATAVVMRVTAFNEPRKIPVFKADHPFIFIIQEKETGSILFLGKVNDPTKSG